MMATAARAIRAILLGLIVVCPSAFQRSVRAAKPRSPRRLRLRRSLFYVCALIYGVMSPALCGDRGEQAAACNGVPAIGQDRHLSDMVLGDRQSQLTGGGQIVSGAGHAV